MIFEELSTQIVSLLMGGGVTGLISLIAYRKLNKRLKESEVKLAEANVALSEANVENAKMQGKSDEWHIWKEQNEALSEQNKHLIERNDQLVKMNAEKEDRHQQDIRDWEERFTNQTTYLRGVQRDLIAANDREKEHIRREGLLLRRIQYLISFVCKRTDCDHGIPPRQHLLGCAFDESQIEDAEREKEITIELTKD